MIRRYVRPLLRQAFFSVLDKTFTTDDGKRILARSLGGLLDQLPRLPLRDHLSEPAPYPDLARLAEPVTPLRGAPIFVTARFRSGSTLLWNLFRHLEGCTAYYEPLNERRWFDPTRRGNRTDATHRKVSDYWREYDGLGLLADFYREEWIDHELFMGECAWNPEMFAYIHTLVDRAPGRAVLQFNRVDFRLPWLRVNFPGATIVHLYRHPRDQWCSALLGSPFPVTGTVQSFEAYDKFYLLRWAADLKYRFPFLDEETVSHPYELFYAIWRLSYLFGRRYAHFSLGFEDLVLDSERCLTRLFSALNLSRYDLGALRVLIEAPPLGQWSEYADAGWFREQEIRAEQRIARFLAARPVAATPPPSTPTGEPFSQDRPVTVRSFAV